MPPADSAVKPDVIPRTTSGPRGEPETPRLPSPAGARTGPVKTGGRVFVLDHKRWLILQRHSSLRNWQHWFNKDSLRDFSIVTNHDNYRINTTRNVFYLSRSLIYFGLGNTEDNLDSAKSRTSLSSLFVMRVE